MQRGSVRCALSRITLKPTSLPLSFRRLCTERPGQQSQGEGQKSEETSSSSSSSSSNRIIVFGGNGYVGNSIIRNALSMGLEVTSIARSGRPKSGDITGLEAVDWIKGDLLSSNDESWKSHLEGAKGAISCVGAFGSNDWMEKVNGDANINAVSACVRAGVQRFTFISTVENNLPPFILSGYFNGKRRAETAVCDAYPKTGTVLRPSFVYGTRKEGGVSIPLGLIGKPLESILSCPGFNQLKNVPFMKAIFTPPVSVESVGAVAVASAAGLPMQTDFTDADTGALHGIISAEKITELNKLLDSGN